MATFDSSDEYIEVSEVHSESNNYESDIEILKDDINDLKDALEEEDATDEQVALEHRITQMEGELEGLEEEAEPIMELSLDCQAFPEGSTLINESIWVQHCQQLAEDVDGINISNWPFNCINWDDAADSMLIDYSIITFEGQDFYIRS